MMVMPLRIHTEQPLLRRAVEAPGWCLWEPRGALVYLGALARAVDARWSAAPLSTEKQHAVSTLSL